VGGEGEKAEAVGEGRKKGGEGERSEIARRMAVKNIRAGGEWRDRGGWGKGVGPGRNERVRMAMNYVRGA